MLQPGRRLLNRLERPCGAATIQKGHPAYLKRSGKSRVLTSPYGPWPVTIGSLVRSEAPTLPGTAGVSPALRPKAGGTPAIPGKGWGQKQGWVTWCCASGLLAPISGNRDVDRRQVDVQR